jgi:proteasome lid subunit RPN8/RPN11
VSSAVKTPKLGRKVKAPIYDHIFAHDDHEVGGVLVGRLGDSGSPVVTGSIAALEADGQRASVTFTHDAWASIHAQMDERFEGQQIVGWYHSHPGFGIFLSGHDLFIHENFFSDHRQIAYVVDPHAGTEGVFGWRDGQIVLFEETPSGRPGTGGPTVGTRAATAPAAPARDPMLGRVLVLAALLGVMTGIAATLILGGGEDRQPAKQGSQQSQQNQAQQPQAQQPTPDPHSWLAFPSGDGR